MARLHEEVARAKRGATPLSLGIMDIDHFKSVNDTYGHAAGDEVLREVVGRSALALRPYDALGRVGGEEFLMLIPGAAREDAWSVLERVRRVVGDTPIEYSDQLIDVTVSIGGTVALADEPVDQMLIRADEALYRAKELGRNRIETSPET